MGLIVKQDGKRSELQERIAAELREKAERTSNTEDEPKTDFLADSKYLENTKNTTGLMHVWLLLFFAIVVAVVIVFIVF